MKVIICRKGFLYDLRQADPQNVTVNFLTGLFSNSGPSRWIRSIRKEVAGQHYDNVLDFFKRHKGVPCCKTCPPEWPALCNEDSRCQHNGEEMPR